jgi:hypothetical protein
VEVSPLPGLFENRIGASAMIAIQTMKFVNMLYPQIKDDGDLADNNAVDTSGWNHLRVLVQIGNLDAALGSTAEGNAVKVEECNTSGGSYTDVANAALADAIGAAEDGLLFAIDIDLRKTHKRFMRLNTPHAGDGTNGVNASAIGILSMGSSSPLTAAGMGLAELINA